MSTLAPELHHDNLVMQHELADPDPATAPEDVSVVIIEKSDLTDPRRGRLERMALSVQYDAVQVVIGADEFIEHPENLLSAITKPNGGAMRYTARSIALAMASPWIVTNALIRGVMRRDPYEGHDPKAD